MATPPRYVMEPPAPARSAPNRIDPHGPTGEAGYIAGAEQEAATTMATSGPEPWGTPPATTKTAAAPASSNPFAGISPTGLAYLASLPNNPSNANAAVASVVQGMVNQGLPQDLAAEFQTFMVNYVTGKGTPNGLPATTDEAEAALYQQPFFQNRFPGIGQLGITPAQWIDLEQSYYQTASAAGMPGFVTQADAAQLIQGHVSANELSTRLADAYNASKGADPDVVAALNAQGISQGDIAKLFLDPDNQVNALTQKVTTAQVAGIAQEAGFTGLSAAQAGQVAQGIQASASGAPAPMTEQQIKQNNSIQQAEYNVGLTKATASGTNAINTLTAGEVLGAALGVGVSGETVQEEQRDVAGAIETKAGAASGGGGFSATKRGAALGYGSEEGAANDVMGG